MEVETIEVESKPVQTGYWTYQDRALFDGAGQLAASVRSADDARRMAAALNLTEGMATEALEAWTVGVISDPVNDLLGQLESVLLLEPHPSERRRGERRQAERRRALTEVRIDQN